MNRSIALLLVAPFLQATTSSDSGFVAVDYGRIERRIVKEPTCVAPPLYALFILDPAGKVRVWARLDKSAAELPYYDVLYFDRDADGDLAELGERFTGAKREIDEHYGFNVRIPIGDFAVPGTSLRHTSLEVWSVVKSGEGRKGVFFSMKWDGKEEVGGGYTNGIDQTQWAASPKDAPVLRPTPLGPLAFAFWLTGPLKIGASSGINLMVGSPGSADDTFCALSENFLVPGKDRIRATLIAKDRNGKELRIPHDITSHC